MMKLRLVIMLAVFSSLLGQMASAQYTYASPVDGWDSLRTHIRYPELLRRAGIEGCAFVDARIDSTGEILAPVAIHATSDQFEGAVHDALFQTKWHPAIDNGKPVSSVIQFPVFFFLKGNNTEKRIIIERERPQIYH